MLYVLSNLRPAWRNVHSRVDAARSSSTPSTSLRIVRREHQPAIGVAGASFFHDGREMMHGGRSRSAAEWRFREDEARRAFEGSLGAIYQFERLLGHGGMGNVALARHRARDERVAIKLLHPELSHCGGTAACHTACNGGRNEDCAAGTTCTGVCTGKAEHGGADAAPVESARDAGAKHKP